MNSIVVPDSLPEILKNYVKAAIRSQPADIISWSAEYFKTTDEQYSTLLNGNRENNTDYKHDRTLFRILAFQLGTTIGTKERIEEVWSDLSLDFSLLEDVYRIGKFHGEHVDMVEFLGITFGHWTKSLKETVLLCCEAFCKCLATDGYFLHADVACKLYGFLAKLNCSLPAVHGGDGRSQARVALDDQNNNAGDKNDNNPGRPAVKTSKSLDTPFPSKSLKLAAGDFCTSLESVFERPAVNIGSPEIPVAARYHVPGIGPSVPKGQVREVFEYFRKCAADNGGYVYDFDIESERCPRLDADI